MADEIRLNLTLSCENGNYYFRRPINKTYTQTTAGQFANTQTIGTTHEAIAVPADIATLGMILIVNHDVTNYVEIGRDVGGTFYAVAKLGPGKPAIFEVPGSTTLYGRANTAACKCEISILSA